MLTRMFVLTALVVTLTGVAAAQARHYLPITIGVAGAVDDAPIFVGVDQGIFAKFGLDAKVKMYESGIDMMNGLVNGDQQVNIMGSIPFLVGVSKDFPIVLIAHEFGQPTHDYYAANESIVASSASHIKQGDIRALIGKRVGVTFGTGGQNYLLGLLSEAHIPLKDVTMVNMMPAQLVTALKQGDVSAISIWEPWGSLAMTKAKGSVRVVQGNCMSCYDPGTVLTTRSAVKNDPELLQRFMDAFLECEQWVRKNPHKAARIDMLWIQGVDYSTMKLALSKINFDPRISAYTKKMYEAKSIPLLVSQGHIDNQFNPAGAMDPAFLEAAMKKYPQTVADLPPIPPNLQTK